MTEKQYEFIHALTNKLVAMDGKVRLIKIKINEEQNVPEHLAHLESLLSQALTLLEAERERIMALDQASAD